jgi:uncharacterized membrane-anchored protein YitT (DUF2179 family)
VEQIGGTTECRPTATNVMNKVHVFGQIVLRSLITGLLAGLGLGVILGILSGLMLGILALIFAVGIGFVTGAVLGLLNGVLIGLITCVWFTPVQDEKRYRRTVCGWCIAVSISVPVLAHQYPIAVFTGPVAWWAGHSVIDWYQARDADTEKISAAGDNV